MQQRSLGRTGLKVSALGYGAGAVGGLMVRGSEAEQEASLARAFAAGITYVDTAPAYGDGESERVLGRLLKRLAAKPVLGTKVRLPAAARADIPGAIAASLEASLSRLGREQVDLFQLHDPIGSPGGYTLSQVLEEAIPAMQKLREQGKCRVLGITALGDTATLAELLGKGLIDTAQIPFNALNPSWLAPKPARLPGQDFAGIGRQAAAQGVGLIGIRILAAGALSGEEARHPVAMPKVAPIASGADYAADLAEARRLLPLVAEGHAASLAELAIRYALTPPEIGTALIGTASVEQLEVAIAAAGKGPLPAETLARIGALLA
ncbi:aldo/keto reductase [Siccirubricoccus sp. KC 17139]|uniref:Aldo/keto reductase n=1 Tax=Siccirubricoccus soli TaxID=2899147 RepID=A0ABT1D4X2_9PROT|nr:aldo/keto reductase [Siccirubricoccus soli]MCO6416964.1 aldo/keto reductase [Siccirubricoccus soli]MCP2683099.1 aldo/keto reductase [Siccirubricoccus soli]